MYLEKYHADTTLRNWKGYVALLFFFKPSDFSGEKIHSLPSFGGEEKAVCPKS
jgi:hypothetical protein